MIPVWVAAIFAVLRFYGGLVFHALLVAHDEDMREASDLRVTCPVCGVESSALDVPAEFAR